MIPFEALFRNKHVATMATVAVRAHLDEVRFPVEDRLFETEPGVQVRVKSQRPEGKHRGHLVLVHGLEGKSTAATCVAWHRAH
ncbi:MAG: hypothetical protein U5J83_15730 [Bryobacterales bacterium]|nr:hypothetical protein [Bryobacterales bacterium]